MTAMLTADWFLLGRDVYYRKFEIYSMKWQQEVNLENVMASVASYGGPIAIIRDNKKFVKVHGSGKPIIAIYSGSGQQISSLVWKHGMPVTIGWSDKEHLLCIQEDGSVYIHDMFGDHKHMFKIDKECNLKVIDAKIFTNMQGTGVAIMTSSYKVYVVNNVYDDKKYQLHDVPSSCLDAASAWCVSIARGDRHTSVVVARGRDLYRLSAHECKKLYPEFPEFWLNGPGLISEISISYCGKHIAMLIKGTYLWVGSSDCTVKYCEVKVVDEMVNTSISRQLAWCGSEAVILSYGINVTIYGRKDGDAVSYAYDGAVKLLPEIDGVRIISATQHEFIQKVPGSVQQIFRINSTDHGSFLLEASRQYQKRSHRADEYVCIVKPNLKNAVRQCIEAAGHEFDTDTQKMLIRAAQFGRCFLTPENTTENPPVDDYVTMCRKLRVLNAIRDPKIGLPLTMTQVDALGHEALLDRLVARKHFRLAIEVARHLKLPEKDGASRILVRWATYKVSQQQQNVSIDEDILAKEIADKVGGGGVSFSEIAKAAANGGRSKLAIRLLDYEPRARLQVPLLLQLGEAKKALAKSIESGDTDLVYTVILNMRESMPLADFRLTIRNYPAAQALYKKYCREHNPQGLREIHAQEDDWCAQADSYVYEAIEGIGDGLSCEVSLQAANETYKKGRSDLHASICEENSKLVRAQRSLEQSLSELRGQLTGTSVHETCSILLISGEVKHADKIRSDFRIPERRFWWLRAQSLAKRNEWSELEKLSRSKKSPIGYGPFVDVCLEEGKLEEAIKYLPRVSEELKVKYYVKTGMLEEGAKIALEQRSIEALLHVQRRAITINNTQLVQLINQYITQINTRSSNK